MNSCNLKFVKDNNINFDEIDNQVYTNSEINWIVYKYEMQGKRHKDKVSMENLVGFYNPFNDISLTFPEVLDNFFDSNGDSYHSRAVSMLNYDSDTVLDGLKQSFEREPIVTFKVDDDKEVIMTNGMHRFLVLRSLYLKERRKCNSEVELYRLEDKFTIPVEVIENDMTKTYCKYLIDLFQNADTMDCYFKNFRDEHFSDSNKKYSVEKYHGIYGEMVYLSEDEYREYCNSITSISMEYGDNGPTGRVIVDYFDSSKFTIDDERLIELTRDVINDSDKMDDILNDNSYYGLKSCINRYDSLRKFICTNFKEEFKSIVGEKNAVKTK